MDETSHYRKEIYIALAESMKEPTPEFVADLPAIIELLNTGFRFLGYETPTDQIPEPVQSFESLLSLYRLSFIFPPDSRVIPVESVYRPWTLDPTASLPGAHDCGYLQGDPAHHMRVLYELFGLMIPEEFYATPDHLCLQLEFASHLLDSEHEKRLLLFLQEHLTWVDELNSDASKLEIPLFYRQIIALINLFIKSELQRN